MGILNVTPDSFYDGGKHFCLEKAIERGIQIIKEGADIIDIGGESTRPGSKPLSTDEEINRVVPVIEVIRKETDIPISIDTRKSQVAHAAIGAGADMINDVSGLRFDENMAIVASKFNVPIVLMHSRGTPENMQTLCVYKDLYQEILYELGISIKKAVEAGVPESMIIVDPGIGFAKTPEQNFKIIANLGFLASLGKPILVGPSRKSFIGAITGAGPDERLGGTIAAVTASVMNGANFLRVHDVAITKQAVEIAFTFTQHSEKKFHDPE